MAIFWATVLIVWMVQKVQSSYLDLVMVDMSYPLDASALRNPTVLKFQLNKIFNPSDDGSFTTQIEEYSSSTHVGTHIDAPCEFYRDKFCVDQIPIDQFIGPAAVINITDRAKRNRQAQVEVQDLLNWEITTGQSLNSHIVLILTGWGRKWPDPVSFIGTAGNDTSQITSPGLSPAAAIFLVTQRRIKAFGTDTLTLDQEPAPDRRIHRIILGANIYGIEMVANMEQIPIAGATLYVMPVKIRGSGAAPARVIATFSRSRSEAQTAFATSYK